MEPKELKFFNDVVSKTRAGRIKWEPTAMESSYIAAIGGEFTLAIENYQTEDPHVQFALTLKDRERELLRVTTENVAAREGEFRSLYEMARRQAIRGNEKLDKILGELAKL